MLDDAARSRATQPAPATAHKRASRGASRQAMLRAVQDHPGATSAPLVTVSGVERNTIYGLMARWSHDGELQTSTAAHRARGLRARTTNDDLDAGPLTRHSRRPRDNPRAGALSFDWRSTGAERGV